MGSKQLQFLPERLTPDNEPFQIHSRLDVIALLRALQDTGTLVTAYFDHGNSFFVTSVLSVNPDFEELILDIGHDPQSGGPILRSSSITLVAFLDHVKLQFDAPHADATTFEEKPAFRVRLPASVLRLQRRDDFRALAQIAAPPRCHIPIRSRPGETQAVRISDISCGGICIVSRPETLELAPAMILPGCRIELPRIDTIDVTLEVRNAGDYPDAAGLMARRYGCRFVSLPGTETTQIRRYIHLVERERAKVIS